MALCSRYVPLDPPDRGPAFRAADIDGSEDRDISLTAGSRELHFKGQPYLLNFALPNFYFHVTTAYDLLRACGVGIGKMDYIGEV